MAVRARHSKTSAVPDSGDTNLVQPSDWNADHPITADGPGLLGRTAAGAGPVAEVSAADGRALLGLGNAATSALSTTNAAALGTAAPGSETTVARADHVHPMPTAAQVGADPAGTGASEAAAAVNARIQAGTVTGRYARWNQTTSRWEEFDLLGTANTWTAVQVFGGAAGSEGGEFGLQAPVTGTNLTGNVAVDIQGNSFRVFGLFAGQVRGFMFDFGGAPGGIHVVWHTGNQAHVQAGTVTGRYARWDQTTGRYEAFDLLGTANTWSAVQTFPEIRLDAAAGAVRPIEWRTGGLQRWRIVASSDPETGGGAGTNLNFTRFDDAGNNLGAVARIVRNTGVFEFNSGINVAGGSIIYSGITQAVVQTGTATGQVARWNQTTGRYEPVTLNTLPDAADDSAAATAGVAVGGLYRTGSILKTRIA